MCICPFSSQSIRTKSQEWLFVPRLSFPILNLLPLPLPCITIYLPTFPVSNRLCRPSHWQTHRWLEAQHCVHAAPQPAEPADVHSHAANQAQLKSPELPSHPQPQIPDWARWETEAVSLMPSWTLKGSKVGCTLSRLAVKQMYIT